ncbi:MAG TPA: PAS domain S-box protein [Puia sp.]|nr:PAS domain S-box protein [Puia sp.]
MQKLKIQEKSHPNKKISSNLKQKEMVTPDREEEGFLTYLETILDTSDDAIISKGLDGTIISWNKGGEKMFGFTAKEVIGRNISLIIPEECIQEEQMILDKIKDNQTIHNFETIRLKKNGDRFFVSLTVSPLKDSTGKITGISKITRDINERKKAEARQNKSELHYRSLIEQATDAIYTADASLNFTQVNQSGCNLLGYEKEEFLLLSHKDLLFENDETGFFLNREETITGTKFRYQGRMRRKDKSFVEVETTGKILSDGTYLFISRDISERIKSENELERSLKLVTEYKYALDASSIVAVTDQKGIIKHANDNFCKISRYSREELIGKDHRIISSGFHSKEFISHLWVTIANGKIWKGELKNKAKDGSIYWVDTTIVPFLDELEKPYQYVAIRADITKRKIAEEEIKALNEEMDVNRNKRTEELLITNKELAFQNKEKENRAAELVIANENLVLQNIEKENRAAELVIANVELSYQNKEKENRAAELVIANEELSYQNKEKEDRAAELVIANEELSYQNTEKENRAAELVIANENLVLQNIEKENRAAELVIANEELSYQNREKEKRAAELIIANEELIFQNQEKERRAAELIDINMDLRISEHQFKEVNRELESFSYSVSHDLRAPLRAVHGYTKMLKINFENQLGPEAHRLTNNIISSAKKMGQLIDDLLTFSRLGRKELVKKDIDMNEIVLAILKDLEEDGAARVIKWDIQELLPALADKVAMKQVWMNLISNAFKYTRLKETAIIQIGCSKEEDNIIYFIKDNGAGFDMRYADKLFGVFQRLHSEDEFEGTGVGLALVQRIIAKHGGRIWAEGIVEEGAKFYFTLK